MAIAATRRFTAACQTETGSNEQSKTDFGNAKTASGRSFFISLAMSNARLRNEAIWCVVRALQRPLLRHR
jgi:hypothetical protein